MKLSTTAAALAVAAGAGLFALPAAPAQALTNCDVDTAALALNQEEPEVFDTINVMRAEAGLPAVTHTETMSRASEWASNDSAGRGSAPANHVDTLGRDISTRFAECGVPAATSIAEINFYGTNVTPSDAMNFWANSPTHRAIILDGGLTQVGVSVIYKDGSQFWTVTFASDTSEGGVGGIELPLQVTRSNLTGAEHQAAFDELTAKGYRLTDITATSGSDPRYSSTWSFDTTGTPWAARHGVDSATYQAEFDSLNNQGYRLVLVRGYEVNGASHFVGIWEQNDGRRWQAGHDMSIDEFNSRDALFRHQGYTLVQENYYTVNGQTFVAAIWNG
ncbi:CAP domain-containing protein [Nocardia huaxiensis]|uniref:SCP domain-containing protein n=1 Tax=Nocardia huaxiensis TaxID=2755382 RepID=A0A7D6VD08_9NOCA|nr:CAP domain-containing protein [Nocardia huaxiensis]QLY31482.1 hypothetical protein H0264_03810 [Nocardia huaxiensis]UFS95033.1 CAP domain-containing protein [Nocardia huaxiensis]